MRTILCILLFSISLSAVAQKKNKKQKDEQTESTVTIPKSDFLKTENENNQLKKDKVNDSIRYSKLQEDYSQLQKQATQDRIDLAQQKRLCKALQGECDSIKSALYEANYKLVNAISNFLFIPYDAYRIEDIALKFLEKITDESIRNKRKNEITLLQNYKKDIEDMRSFLEDVEKYYKIPPLNPTVIDKYKKLFQELELYKRYLNCGYRSNTYLGKKIDKIIRILSRTEPKDREEIRSIKKELEQCLGGK